MVRKSRRADEQRFRHPALRPPHPARADRRGRRSGAGVSGALGTLRVCLGTGRGSHGRGGQLVYDVQGLAAGTHAAPGARTAVPGTARQSGADGGVVHAGGTHTARVLAGAAERLPGDAGGVLVGAVCSGAAHTDWEQGLTTSGNRNAKWLLNTASRRPNTSRTT